jgi:hypothetical protein
MHESVVTDKQASRPDTNASLEASRRRWSLGVTRPGLTAEEAVDEPLVMP